MEVSIEWLYATLRVSFLVLILNTADQPHILSFRLIQRFSRPARTSDLFYPNRPSFENQGFGPPHQEKIQHRLSFLRNPGELSWQVSEWNRHLPAESARITLHPEEFFE